VADTAAEISFSHSELKTYERCPKQWSYKYLEELVPRKKARPLYFGNWVHRALESHYKQGDWRIGHQEYVADWNALFDEERTELRKRGRGMSPPFPELVERIMKSYVWYYREEGWTPRVIEHEFRVPTPLLWKGKRFIFKGIIDLIVEDSEGYLWVVDHKTATTIPEPTAFHAMDPQLMLYPWAAKIDLGLDVMGVVYNYVKSKAPGIPRINRDGSVSRRRIVTDYPTLRRFLRSEGLDPALYADILRPLRRQSPFLRRYRLPRETFVTREILTDALSVAKHIQTDKRHYRVITRDCQRMCAYHDICRAELNGLDTAHMRKMMFTLKGEEPVIGRSRDIVDPDDFDAEEPD